MARALHSHSTAPINPKEVNTMYRSQYSGDLFAEMERLQRAMQQSFDTVSPSIRGFGRSYPALNVGNTPTSVEIYAFAPGIDPAKIEVNLDRGVLTIEGERTPAALPGNSNGNGSTNANGKSTAHIKERFEGRFRRVVSLPDDVDPDGVKASYRDGVLQISVKRRESAQPRRIQVQ